MNVIESLAISREATAPLSSEPLRNLRLKVPEHSPDQREMGTNDGGSFGGRPILDGQSCPLEKAQLPRDSAANFFHMPLELGHVPRLWNGVCLYATFGGHMGASLAQSVDMYTCTSLHTYVHLQRESWASSFNSIS